MKCKKCGARVIRKSGFCPKCGTRIDDSQQKAINELSSDNQGTYYSSVKQSPSSKIGEYKSSDTIVKNKLKKPLYKRTWFIVLLVFIVLCILISVINSNKSEKIVWSDMVMGSMLPEPPYDRGKIYENSDENLYVDIYKISEKQYSDYVTLCETKGFNVDTDKDNGTYRLYNKDGYKLELSYYGEKLTIDINIPIEMTDIKWPVSKLGTLLPEPKSKKGSFSYENDTDFEVYIADTSKEDYIQYVYEVQKAGFNVDYNKRKNYYSAKNADGYDVTVNYEGYNIMSIKIYLSEEDDLSEENSSNETTATTEKPTEVTTETTEITTESTTKETTVLTTETTIKETTSKKVKEKKSKKETTEKTTSRSQKVVYGSKTGNHYHIGGCRYANGSKMTVAEAERRSWEPCGICNP